MSSTNHPLPPAPGHEYQQRVSPERPGQQRHRAKSSFSFRSNHSHKSSGSAGKIDFTETHAEKESKRLHTKADPSMALSEAEPSAVASGVKSSLAPIRAIQHRDTLGNPIADPDRSNPTRSRWERPLDTIRSFEAAIDGNYKRQSYMRADSENSGYNNNASRRTSYYGGSQAPTNNGYYGRSTSFRPESQYMSGGMGGGYNGRDTYYNSTENVGGPSNGYHPNRARYPRTASEPHLTKSQGSLYPAPGAQHSYETVTTASGSGFSADPAGYLTDPSSENSSVDRIATLPAKDPGEAYGFNGFGGNPQFAPPGQGLNQQYTMNGAQTGAQRQGNGYMNQNQAPPPVPQKGGAGPRVPMKLGKSNSNTQMVEKPANDKRKSWFGKRFSRA